MTSVDPVKVQYIVYLKSRGFWLKIEERWLIRRFFDVHDPVDSYVGRQIARLFPVEADRWVDDRALFRSDPETWALEYFS